MDGGGGGGGGGGQSVVVALDFRATCFMPFPFLEVALRMSWDSFCRSVFHKIYPKGLSDVARCLYSASGGLVQYGVKPIGKFVLNPQSSDWWFFIARSSTPTGRQVYNKPVDDVFFFGSTLNNFFLPL